MSAGSLPARGPVQELGRFLEIQTLGLNLPFVGAFVLAASAGRPGAVPVALLLVAFVGARNAGQSFNRWADLVYDRANPRTQDRALVTGRYRPRTALLLTVANAAVVLVASFFLNGLAFALAPVALAIVLGYSYTKRFSALTTLVLGLVQAIVPAAVYIGLQGRLPVNALWAVGALFAWGTAFETVHSLGDVDSDRALGLHSLALALGEGRALGAIAALHVAALGLLVAFGLSTGFGLTYFVALGAMALFVAGIDTRLLRQQGSVRRPFLWLIAPGVVFLLGVATAVYAPW